MSRGARAIAVVRASSKWVADRARGGGGHLRGLVLRAQVLDHLVRCEDVAAYLLPPLGEHLVSADLGERLHLVRLGLGIGLGLVLGLAALT